MYSYNLLEKNLEEQCNLTEDKDKSVEWKASKQNPSDSGVTYSGHRGQGFKVQIQDYLIKAKKRAFA